MHLFYLTEQHSKFLLHSLQLLYMCTICDSTNINTIIEFVPNCLLLKPRRSFRITLCSTCGLACWITKVTNTHSEHILTYCFSTITIVARTDLNVPRLCCIASLFTTVSEMESRTMSCTNENGPAECLHIDRRALLMSYTG